MDAGEGCDDGNVVSGDGCSSSCALESLSRSYSYTVTTYTLVKELKSELA